MRGHLFGPGDMTGDAPAQAQGAVAEGALQLGLRGAVMQVDVHRLVGEGGRPYGAGRVPVAPATGVDDPFGAFDGVGVQLDGGRSGGVPGEQAEFEAAVALDYPGLARHGCEGGTERVRRPRPPAQQLRVAVLVGGGGGQQPHRPADVVGGGEAGRHRRL
ncbi:hypothetical protein SVIOM342S_04795 [Streptomyces violaceorubidus]